MTRHSRFRALVGARGRAAYHGRQAVVDVPPTVENDGLSFAVGPIAGETVKISARNVIDGVVKEIRKGVTTSHVVIAVSGTTLTASITNESVDELGLQPGMKVKAVVKSSDVMVAVPD